MIRPPPISTVPCPGCAGSGRIIRTERGTTAKCTYCKGTGRVSPERAEGFREAPTAPDLGDDGGEAA